METKPEGINDISVAAGTLKQQKSKHIESGQCEVNLDRTSDVMLLYLFYN